MSKDTSKANQPKMPATQLEKAQAALDKFFAYAEKSNIRFSYEDDKAKIAALEAQLEDQSKLKQELKATKRELADLRHWVKIITRNGK